MESHALILVALAIVGFGLVSGRAQSGIVTPPMAFVAFGVMVGPLGFGLLEFDVETPWIHTLAELTLILVLFTDATRIELRRLYREHDLPVRMLAVGLPLTILAGTLVAMGLFPGLIFWEAALLAAILSPTDAALGQAVVSRPDVPSRIRQALNVESGLNDGIMVPVVLILLSCTAVASMVEEEAGAAFWTLFTAKQVLLGPLVGVAVGFLGGKLVERSTRSGWMSHPFQQLCAVGLSILAFAGAELVGGNGFIAAFVAGLAVGNFTEGICECLYEFGEAEGQLLSLLMFMVFGVVMVPVAVEHLTAEAVVYALLSLTVIRMLPVALGFLGAGLRGVTTGFLGWFGPRGIASILFVLLVVEREFVHAREEILVVVVTTVLLSTFLHGLTANPLAKRYAERMRRETDREEHMPVAEMPLRLRS